MVRIVRSTLVASLTAGALLLGVACSSNATNPAQPGGSEPIGRHPGFDRAASAAGQRQQSRRFDRTVGGGNTAGSRPDSDQRRGRDGFIVEKDGYIMTNNHVVLNANGTGNASQIQVGLNDGSTYTAKVIGTDARSDLALIKIDANNLPILKIGTDENTFVGEDVIAIGYALDLGNGAGAPTVSRGIVSAKNRAIDEGTGQNSVLGSIQTDASINHGNSGGPLSELQRGSRGREHRHRARQ